jgi:hypothetical protein
MLTVLYFTECSNGIMDISVQTVVTHATLICVTELKEIVHMDALKDTQDTSVYFQVFEI